MSEPIVETNENLKPGIIYFSRLPPFMKPAKVRYIFAQYGEVGRLFLQAEGIKKIVRVFDKGVGSYPSNYRTISLKATSHFY